MAPVVGFTLATTTPENIMDRFAQVFHVFVKSSGHEA